MVKEYLESTIESYDKTVEEYKKNTEGLLNKEKLQKFLERLPEGGKILDVGCAFGRDSKFLSERGFSVQGIDLSEGMIQEAKTYAPKATFAVMDMLSMDFPDEKFDGVWANAALVHLKKEDVRLALAELKRVLKPKGVIYLTLKEGEGERIVEDSRYSGDKKFFSFFGKEEVVKLIQEIGFVVAKEELGSTPGEFEYNSHRRIRVLAMKP